MTRARDLSQVLNDVGSISTNDIANGAVTQVKLDSNINLGVRVASVAYPGDDTAADPAGGQTITITGAGFASTPTVYVDTTIAPSVTYVSPTQITFVSPAKSAGTYNLFVINPDGSTAIHVMGMSYSGVPSWTTPAGSLGSVNAAAISIQLVATGDTPLVYTLTSGSSLPAGVTLSSSGLISGSVPTAQTFSFSVDVTDPQYQTTPRSFSITVTVGEPYFQYVTLLLHGNQPSGVTDTNNNVFKDSSANNFTITRPVGANTMQGTFSPFSKVNGRWAAYFNGSSYLNAVSNAAFAFGTSNFTLEAFVYVPSYPSAGTVAGNIICAHNWNGSGFNFTFRMSTTGYLYFEVSGGGNVTSSSVVALNTWTHVACVRNGGTVTFYINGTSAGSASIATSISSTTAVSIGHSLNGGTYGAFTGWISNARITNGGALYTSNFTPSTSPLTTTVSAGTVSLLACQSNNFKDNSANAFALTTGGALVQTFSPFPTLTAYAAGTNGGSGYFDGTSDYLSCTSNAAYQFGTGDFTVEMWMYTSGFNGTAGRVFFYATDGNYTGGGYGLEMLSTTNISFGRSSGTVTIYSSAPVNQWFHFALVRSSGTLKAYINGVSVYSASDSYDYNYGGSYPFTVGSGRDASGTYVYGYNGYISNFRAVKGTAVYTSNFTVPTAPLTAIANTSLLLNFTNGGIIDNSMSNDLETVGNAQISTTQSKWGGASMYFDGNGDYLFVPNTNLSFNFGTGDFTVEGWIYLSGTPASAGTIIDTRSSDALAEYYISISSSNKLDFIYSSSRVTSATSISNTTWTHFAITRSSGTIRLFINGTLDANTASYSGTVNASATPAIGGGRAGGTSAITGYYFNGYIDDLRISKGLARYTTNFTPPTGPFDDNGV